MVNLHVRLRAAPKNLLRVASAGSESVIYLPVHDGRGDSPRADQPRGWPVWSDRRLCLLLDAHSAVDGLVIDLWVVTHDPDKEPAAGAAAA
jgi:hypothetical protein